jgi:hypothetical protein
MFIKDAQEKKLLTVDCVINSFQVSYLNTQSAD